VHLVRLGSRRLARALALAALVLTSVVSPASAWYGADPVAGPPGSQVQVGEENFGPNETVDVYWDFDQKVVARPVTDSMGQLVVTLTVPSNAPLGPTSICFHGPSGGDGNGCGVGFTVTSSAAPAMRFPWDKRENPWALTQGPHDWAPGSLSGLDFDKDRTPRRVLSMFGGEVTFVGDDQPFTCLVNGQVVRNPTVKVRASGSPGWELWYLHLSRFSVAIGDHVRQGQELGYSGDLGCSTAVHLHVELLIDGRHASWWGHSIDGWTVGFPPQDLYSSNGGLPPSAPSNVRLSTSCGCYRWTDNATDESGFRVYKNSDRVADLPANTTSWGGPIVISCRDVVSVSAWNDAGESSRVPASNPYCRSA
jgi:murein DD-endopeptidase MepM/ murein hydrolase activator NlpD